MLLDGSAVEPDVLPADESVFELEDVQDPKGDAPPVAGQAEHRASDRSGHLLVKDHRVGRVVPAGVSLFFRLEVRGELLVEPPRCLLAVQDPGRPSDDIVLDVIGVHGHCPATSPTPSALRWRSTSAFICS